MRVGCNVGGALVAFVGYHLRVMKESERSSTSGVGGCEKLFERCIDN